MAGYFPSVLTAHSATYNLISSFVVELQLFHVCLPSSEEALSYFFTQQFESSLPAALSYLACDDISGALLLSNIP
jgi:hypothetical protein